MECAVCHFLRLLSLSRFGSLCDRLPTLCGLLLQYTPETCSLCCTLHRLAQGFFDGFTGVISKPLEGASEHGVSGFAKGVVRGFAGVFLKPVAGILDFMQETTQVRVGVLGAIFPECPFSFKRRLASMACYTVPVSF